MDTTTQTEKRILKILATDISNEHNASSLANELGITRMGAHKAVKELVMKKLVKGKKLGKSTFYHLDFNDSYTRKNVELVLIEQSKAYQRWVDEFSEIQKYVKIIILFGSVLKNASSAHDIDLLLVFDKRKNRRINELIAQKNQVLTKRVHPIKQTPNDFLTNLKIEDRVLLSAIRTGIVLYGFENFLEVINNVTS
jgi:DNA-binding Lrp family transcriptional regulator